MGYAKRTESGIMAEEGSLSIPNEEGSTSGKSYMLNNNLCGKCHLGQ